MTNILNQIQEFVENVTGNPKTNQELLTLKKELANSIVEKLEKENPDLLISLDKELVAEYLVHEGIMDGLKDSILEKTLLKLSKLAPQLTTWREQINTIKTAEQLKDLETEILWGQQKSEQKSESTPDATSQSSIETEEKKTQTSSSVKSTIAPATVAVGVSSYEELKKANKLWEAIGFDPKKIESQPFRKNPKTGVTLCAATAKFNAMDFGLDLPSGNAYDAGKIVPDSLAYQTTLPAAKKDLRPSTNWEALSLEKFNEVKGVNVADIYPYSKSKYGHRAVAFRDKKGQWFVLDPYVKIKGFESNEPKPLEAYMKIRPIYKSHFYTSPGYEKQVA